MRIELTRLTGDLSNGLTISLFKEILWALAKILVKVESCTNYGNSGIYNDAYHFYDFLLTKETFKGDIKKQEKVLQELKQGLLDFAQKQNWNLEIQRESIKDGYVLVRVIIRV